MRNYWNGFRKYIRNLNRTMFKYWLTMIYGIVVGFIASWFPIIAWPVAFAAGFILMKAYPYITWRVILSLWIGLFVGASPFTVTVIVDMPTHNLWSIVLALQAIVTSFMFLIGAVTAELYVSIKQYVENIRSSTELFSF